MEQFRIDGQVVVITGAGGGIGRSIAELFARSGASVVVSDLDKQAADKVVSNIEADGGKAIAVACDVTNDTALDNLVNEAITAFGKITTLVNNAGGGGPKPFDMDINVFRKVFDLNVFSIFRLSQLCAPHMEKNGGGVILNISSIAAENKNKDMSAYGASKAAVSHLTRNIAFDLGPKGIRVNGIAPGAIKTDALKKVLTPEIETNMLKHTPIKRLGEAEDIANGALFLCSPAASWISGQILTISGGGTQELN